MSFLLVEIDVTVDFMLIGVVLGILGQYYSVRHALGQYRSAGVTAAYSVSSPDKPDLLLRLRFALERSVQATIRQHPGLLFGVSDEKSAGIPLFRQLHQIDREDVLEVIHSCDARSMGVISHLTNISV